MTKTDRAYLSALARPASRSKLTMLQRQRLALAGLKIQARRNKAAARGRPVLAFPGRVA